MGVMFENLDVREDRCWWKDGIGSMVVPRNTGGYDHQDSAPICVPRTEGPGAHAGQLRRRNNLDPNRENHGTDSGDNTVLPVRQNSGRRDKRC